MTGLLAEAREVNIKEGTSKVLKADKVKDVEVLKKEIASAAVLSDDEIIIDAKKAGTTVVNINNGKTVESVVVNVKKQNITDAMIEVDVQILEILHNDDLNYGIDWPTLLQGPPPDNGLPLSPLNALEVTPNSMKAFGGTFNRGQINLLVDFLVKNNYAKILAKPKLLTANGKKARFMSGGEVPLVTVNTQGQASVDWKKYGVTLDINPSLDKQNDISAEVRAEVSTLDYSNAVDLGKSLMPAVKTRWVETNVTIEPDNTMIIAGLIENSEMKVTSGVPVLSGIPLLGELFKNTSTSNQKTELVIFVTPKISGQESQ
jgi:pilus assembly protein CpaC